MYVSIFGGQMEKIETPKLYKQYFVDKNDEKKSHKLLPNIKLPEFEQQYAKIEKRIISTNDGTLKFKLKRSTLKLFKNFMKSNYMFTTSETNYFDATDRRIIGQNGFFYRFSLLHFSAFALFERNAEKTDPLENAATFMVAVTRMVCKFREQGITYFADNTSVNNEQFNNLFGCALSCKDGKLYIKRTNDSDYIVIFYKGIPYKI